MECMGECVYVCVCAHIFTVIFVTKMKTKMKMITFYLQKKRTKISGQEPKVKSN